jgi:hypothetical protein
MPITEVQKVLEKLRVKKAVTRKARIARMTNETPIVFTPDEITRMQKNLKECMREDVEDAKEWMILKDKYKKK